MLNNFKISSMETIDSIDINNTFAFEIISSVASLNIQIIYWSTNKEYFKN